MRRLAVAAIVMVAATGAPAHADGVWKMATPAWSWPRGGFLDVAATATNDVWAVGFQGEVCTWTISTTGGVPVPVKNCLLERKPAIQRWNGTTWTRYGPGPWASGTGEVGRVFAFGPGDVYLAGRSQSRGATVVRWDGRAFQTLPDVPPDCASGTYERDATAVWAIGTAALCRFDGAAWNRVSPPDPGGSFTSRSFGIGPGGLWAVRTVSGSVQALTRWTGTVWSDAATIATEPGHAFAGISPLGGDDVWFAHLKPVTSTGWGGLDWTHWDGTSVTATPSRSPQDDIRFTTDDTGRPLAYRGWAERWAFDGSAWTPVPAEVPSNFPAGYKPNKVARVPGTLVKWVVGEGYEWVALPKTDPVVMSSE
ncbi:hypothetical protein [Actinocorallia longicatena]|uniref:Tachylectin n=1 Tax=Actinocorallia longicatena TaxID=111803 RepID=A0ABP6QG93_9ACTN